MLMWLSKGREEGKCVERWWRDSRDLKPQQRQSLWRGRARARGRGRGRGGTGWAAGPSSIGWLGAMANGSAPAQRNADSTGPPWVSSSSGTQQESSDTDDREGSLAGQLLMKEPETWCGMWNV